MTYQSPPERPGTQDNRGYWNTTSTIVLAFIVVVILAVALAWPHRTTVQQRTDVREKPAASSPARSPTTPPAK